MKVLRWLDEYLEEAIMVVLLVCMVCIMGLQVVMRYVFNQSLSWSEELTQYMFVWTTFISVSYCVKKRISIKIEQIINALPQPGQTGLRLFRHALVFVFCIVMIPYAVTYVQQAIDSEATSAALGIPMYFIQSAPLVGFILLTVRVVQAFWREANIMVGYRKKDPKAIAAAEALTENPTVEVFLPDEAPAVAKGADSGADGTSVSKGSGTDAAMAGTEAAAGASGESPASKKAKQSAASQVASLYSAKKEDE